MSFAVLTDLTKCAGCKACVWACKEANGLPRDDDGSALSASSWTAIENVHGLNVKRQCMHCEDPTCVSVCPVGAFTKTEAGPVVYDETRCIGCRYCMLACPFGIPKYQWSSNTPKVQKCMMCFDRAVSKGEPPACVRACPTGATIFGRREDLVSEALGRIDAQPDLYVPHVYGLKEAGGTCVLYLSSVPFDELGFPVGLRDDSYPRLTWDVLSKLPNVVSIAGVGLLGIWWITKRRDEVARAEMRDEAAVDEEQPSHGEEKDER